MIEALIICGCILVVGVGMRREVRNAQARLDTVQQPIDTPHQAETRDYLLRGGRGVEFGERIALCNQLDAIIALPETDIAPLRFPYDHERDE